MSKTGSSNMGFAELAVIVSIAAAAFVFNTSEFMPIGLLVSISSDFGITEAQGGTIITAYAWAVCLLSVPLMVAASRFSFKPLLLVVVGVFVAGQVGSALASDYWTLLAARLVVACAHAVFWSIAAPIAVRCVSVDHQPAALSAIITGSSVAQILGLPLGRMVGLALGWRATFACIAACSVTVLIALAVSVPKLASGEPFRLRELPELVKNPVLASVFAGIAFTATAYYTGYSYVEPFLQQVGGQSDGVITCALMVFGVAGIVGSLLFARLYVGQRRRFWYLRISVAGIAASLALMVLAAPSVAAIMAMFVLWGVCATSFNVAFQAEILKYAPESGSAVAMSIYSGIFNLGIGAGSAIGGAVSSTAGMQWVGMAGAAVGIAAVAVVCIALVPAMRRTKPNA